MSDLERANNNIIVGNNYKFKNRYFIFLYFEQDIFIFRTKAKIKYYNLQ